MTNERRDFNDVVVKDETNKSDAADDESLYVQETVDETKPTQPYDYDDELSHAGTLGSMSVMFAEAKHQNKNHPYDHNGDDDDVMTTTSMATILNAKQKPPRNKGPKLAATGGGGGGTMFISMNQHELAAASNTSVQPSRRNYHDDDDNLSGIIGKVDLQEQLQGERDVVDVEGQDNASAIYGYPIGKDDQGKEQPSKVSNKLRVIALCCLGVAMVAVIILGVVLALNQRQNDSTDSGGAAVPPVGTSAATLSPTGFGAPSPMNSDPNASPTASPTHTPTAPPTINYIDPLMEFLEDNQVTFVGRDPKSPSYMAVQWLAEEANEAGEPLVYDEKLLQRYALLAIDFALERPGQQRNSAVKAEVLEDFNYFSTVYTVAKKHVDECDWEGILCHNVTGAVTEVRFGHSSLSGTLAPEVGLLKELTVLDLCDNTIHGTIPDEFYQLSLLEEFYGYQNELSGPLSWKIENLSNLTRLHLSHNKLSGSLPESLKSTDFIRPIRYLNLYSNQLTGTIPESLRLRNLIFLDLGRNSLYGTLPYDIGETFVELRNLHLDFNRLNGTIPESYTAVGNGRLESLTLNNNLLSGWVPDNFELHDKLIQLSLHNNSFDGLGKDTCKLSVFDSGEMVEFSADCDICDCQVLCDRCSTDGGGDAGPQNP